MPTALFGGCTAGISTVGVARKQFGRTWDTFRRPCMMCDTLVAASKEIWGSTTAMCDRIEGRHQGKPEVVGLRGVHTSQTKD